MPDLYFGNQWGKGQTLFLVVCFSVTDDIETVLS